MPADVINLALISLRVIAGFWITLWPISLAIHDSSIGDPRYSLSMVIAAETPWGWLAIVSPLMLSFVLPGPLGVGLVERRMQKKRPEAFADYARRTSMFVPWFPKV